jgi:2-iminobutanoate/2-iminopropanoate deaminase
VTSLPYSPTRTANDLIFVSGQIGFDDDGNLPEEFGRQMELAVKGLKERLEEEGASLASVVKVTNFIVDRRDFAEMNEIHGRLFPQPYPTRSTIVTDLVEPEFRFEIEAIAVRA